MADKIDTSPRYLIQLRTIYDTGEEYWTAKVIDMSVSGMFVETHHELPEGKRVTVMLEDEHERDELPFELHAEVARSNEYDLENHWDRTPGIAFHLVDMSDSQRETLQAFLEAHGKPLRE